MSMTGCAEPKIEVRYVDRVVEKVVPVPCKLPKVECAVDMGATYTEKVTAMGKCIEDYRSRDEAINENK